MLVKMSSDAARRGQLAVITTTRVRERASGIFYGWWIVCGAFAVQLLMSALLTQAFGAYVPVLQEQFGWSKSALAGAYSAQRIQSGIFGPVQGWLLTRFGPRTVMRVGMVFFGVGLMLFSQFNSLLTFYLTFLIAGFGTSMVGPMSLITTLVNWFSRRRATALGVAQMGMSVGGLLVPVVAYSLVQFGWRSTAFFSGVIILVVGLPITQLIRTRPEDYGEVPDGRHVGDLNAKQHAVSEEETEEEPEFTIRQAMRTRAFWLISFGHASAVLVVSAVLVHLIIDLNEGLGYSLPAAAAIVSVMTTCQMIGLPLGGMLGDRFEKRRIATLAMFGHGIALIVLANATGIAMVLLFAVMHGLAWGMRGPLMQAMRADYFGRRAFAQVMGVSTLIVMAGMTSGPLIAGFLADRTGDYQLGFTVLGIAAIVGSLFFILLRKPTYSRG